MNPLLELKKHGQAVWLDFIQRSLIDSGELRSLIMNDGLTGLTSNPVIFERAITQEPYYHEAIAKLSAEQKQNPKALYEKLAIKDIQDAADILFEVYEKTQGQDGYASLEVSPHLAFDASGTIEEGLRLWKDVARPNVMIKVPGSKEGMVAIRALIAQGVNVNVTLLFAVEAYKEAASAYLWGLRDRLKAGQDISHVSSVASFFVSRIDTLVDQKLSGLIHESKKGDLARTLLGKVAIANAKLAYEAFQKIYAEEENQKLIRAGAKAQRLLWASTGTKNPQYSDVLYVESLIGDRTINTLPPKTLDAFRDHGKVSATLSEGLSQAEAVMKNCAALGIDFGKVCEQLLSEGVVIFEEGFDKLLHAIQDIQEQSLKKKLNFK